MATNNGWLNWVGDEEDVCGECGRELDGETYFYKDSRGQLCSDCICNVLNMTEDCVDELKVFKPGDY